MPAACTLPKFGTSVVCVCPQCSKQFKVPYSVVAKGKGKYCSKACVAEAKSILKSCRTCGKEFRCKLHRHKEGAGIYCSKECYLIGHSAGHQKKPRVQHTCEVCGKITLVLPCWMKTRKYCSPRCTAIHAAEVVSKKTSNTWIEIEVAEILQGNGIVFESQKALLGLTLADFFIEPNIVIYTDGTFWHSSPKKKQQDGFVSRKLEKAGYKVLRFSEERIETDISGVERDILEVCYPSHI